MEIAGISDVVRCPNRRYFERAQGIYDKNPMLLARQEVDVAESRAETARGRTLAARSGVEAAQHHVQAVQAQLDAAGSQVEQAQAAAEAAQEQVNVVAAQEKSASKQALLATQDVMITGKQQAVSRAKTFETRFQANAERSALKKSVFVSGYTRIRAPFDGTVTKRSVDRGAFIQTAAASQNPAPIATIANLQKVRVYLTVPETQAGFVQVGTAVTVVTNGLPDAAIKGRVSRTAGALDAKIRTLLAEVDLPNRDGKILTGAYATARVVMETHPGVVSVPTLAVGAEKSGKFVFVIDNAKARRIPVTTGFDDGTFTEIVAGLHGGEKVVVTGRDALTPNANVRATPWIPLTKK